MSQTARRRFQLSCEDCQTMADWCRNRRQSEPIPTKCSTNYPPEETPGGAIIYFIALTLSSAVVGQGLVWILNRLYS